MIMCFFVLVLLHITVIISELTSPPNNCGWIKIIPVVGWDEEATYAPMNLCVGTTSDVENGRFTSSKYICVNDEPFVQYFSTADCSGDGGIPITQKQFEYDCNPSICDYVAYTDWENIHCIHDGDYRSSVGIINYCIHELWTNRYFTISCDSTSLSYQYYSDSECTQNYRPTPAPTALQPTPKPTSTPYCTEVTHCGAANVQTSTANPIIATDSTSTSTKKPTTNTRVYTTTSTIYKTRTTNIFDNNEVTEYHATKDSISVISRDNGCNYVNLAGIGMQTEQCATETSGYSMMFHCNSNNNVDLLEWDQSNCDGAPEDIKWDVAEDVDEFQCNGTYESTACEEATLKVYENVVCEGDYSEFRAIINQCFHMEGAIYREMKCTADDAYYVYYLGGCDPEYILNASSIADLAGTEDIREVFMGFDENVGCVQIICGNGNNTHVSTKTYNSNNDNDATSFMGLKQSYLVYIAIGGSVLLMLVIGVIVGVCIYKKRQKGLRQIKQLNEIMDDDEDVHGRSLRNELQETLASPLSQDVDTRAVL